MSNTDYVTASKPGSGGAIRMAPVGTALPTSATDTLAAAWVTLGYISEDGITNSNAPENTSTKAWGGNVVLDGENGKTDTWKYKLLEYLNENALKLVYCEDNVVVATDGSITIHANNREHEKHAFVIDEILADGRKQRTCIAEGKLTGLEDIVHKDGEPMGYGVTVTGYENEAHKVTDSDGTVYNDTHVTYISAA